MISPGSNGNVSHERSYTHTTSSDVLRSGGGSPTEWYSSLPHAWKIQLSTEPKIVQAAFKYLSNQSFSLWADWDISRLDSRLLAARWLAGQYEAFAKVAHTTPKVTVE